MIEQAASELKALLQSGWAVKGFQPVTEFEDGGEGGEQRQLNGFAILLQFESDVAIATVVFKNGAYRVLRTNLLTSTIF
ncbi:hypothetical protein [Coralliovum pocilloporae]|uniref:hypothetical protein n=1 Tax=Coralliovum pocilloporae TaxID=3066369 RepID=UPI0033074C64